ncbi:MAG: phospho-N-acetylmuramoyl-pentapeptide-transferase [Clostridia bacterium]|nr:phospho-N-acetylmuramoyl-pentapeptide-transferase [Clostridia bacterium]
MDTVIYKLILAAAVSFCIAVVLAPIFIPVLHKLKFGQEIREIGPSWHKKKSGTPTMGGIIFIIPVIVCSLIFIRSLTGLCLVLFGASFGLIGFVDDYIKVVKKRNLGLTEKQKFLAQLAASVIFLFVAMHFDIITDDIVIPFFKSTVSLGVLYIPFALLVLLGTTNAVNLTDGVDGLASGVTVVVSLFFALLAYLYGSVETAEFAVIVLGGCLGFFVFNRHPAKVFMGDTGSLFLGGSVCAMALVLKAPLLLVIAGGVYVLETLSVIIQVTSFKLTGKRVFKMSPLHHHFEMCGWSENKIVLTAVTASLVLGAVALLGGIAVG